VFVVGVAAQNEPSPNKEQIVKHLFEFLAAEDKASKDLPIGKIEKFAKDGDVEAGTALGVLLLYSDYPDFREKALFWLDASARKGEHRAIKEIATAFMRGSVVEKDLDKAAEYLCLSSDADYLSVFQQLQSVRIDCVQVTMTIVER
jgi:TPR repeat protein